jgi:hypothetical protein
MIILQYCIDVRPQSYFNGNMDQSTFERVSPAFNWSIQNYVSPFSSVSTVLIMALKASLMSLYTVQHSR